MAVAAASGAARNYCLLLEALAASSRKLETSRVLSPDFVAATPTGQFAELRDVKDSLEKALKCALSHVLDVDEPLLELKHAGLVARETFGDCTLFALTADGLSWLDAARAQAGCLRLTLLAKNTVEGEASVLVATALARRARETAREAAVGAEQAASRLASLEAEVRDARSHCEEQRRNAEDAEARATVALAALQKVEAALEVQKRVAAARPPSPAPHVAELTAKDAWVMRRRGPLTVESCVLQLHPDELILLVEERDSEESVVQVPLRDVRAIHLSLPSAEMRDDPVFEMGALVAVELKRNLRDVDVGHESDRGMLCCLTSRRDHVEAFVRKLEHTPHWRRCINHINPKQHQRLSERRSMDDRTPAPHAYTATSPPAAKRPRTGEADVLVISDSDDEEPPPSTEQRRPSSAAGPSAPPPPPTASPPSPPPRVKTEAEVDAASALAKTELAQLVAHYVEERVELSHGESGQRSMELRNGKSRERYETTSHSRLDLPCYRSRGYGKRVRALLRDGQNGPVLDLLRAIRQHETQNTPLPDALCFGHLAGGQAAEVDLADSDDEVVYLAPATVTEALVIDDD